MALYQVSSASYNLAYLPELVTPNDAVLLLGDGVYQQATLPPLLCSVFAREQDLQTRGLRPVSQVQLIDNSKWLALCLNHTPVMSLY